MAKPETGILNALASMVLAASFLSSCVAPSLSASPPAPPVVSRDLGTIKLNLADLSGPSRRSQWVPDSFRARLRIDGADLSSPIGLTLEVANTATASVTVTQIPVGTHRVVTLERLNASGAVLPGGTLKTTADIVLDATASATLNTGTTPRGSVFEQLIAYDRGHSTQLTKNTDPAQVQALVDQLLQQDALYPQLIDTSAISTSIIGNHRVPAYSAAFASQPAAVDVTLEGVPSSAPADVWLEDPLSPKNVSLYSGTHRVSPIVPGTWVLHASSSVMEIERTMSLTLAPGQLATVSLNFGGGAEQIKTPIATGIKAAATIPAVFNGQEVMLMLGGLSRATDSIYTTNSMRTFDGTTLTNLPYDLPSALAYGQGVASGSTFYVAGGVSDARAAVLTQDVYRFSGSSWSTLTLPAARGGCSVAALNGDVYVIGGFQNPPGGQYLDYYTDPTQWVSNTVFKYDGSSWITIPATLNYARGDMAAVTLNNRIYVFGGATYNYYCDAVPMFEVESLDATSSAWRVEKRMPTPRSGAAAVVANGLIYVIGGNANGGCPVGSVEVFNPVTGTWSIRPPLKKSRGYVSAAFLNGQIVVVGGGDGGPAGNDALPVTTVEAFTP